MDFKDTKERFIKICREEIHRDGINELLDYLEKSDFFTAPASTKFHGAYAGGLCEHSLNVYDELVKLVNIYRPKNLNPESVAIIALFHDLCKVNLYGTERRNRKNDSGQWEAYDAFISAEKFCFGGHGSKSVFIVQNYIKLTAEEAVAINCHMSCWDGNKDVGKAFEQFPMAWLVHVADEAATFLVEGGENGIR